MSDEQNENRINIADLPQPEEELSSEDVKKVRGGGDLSTADATGGAGAGKIKFNEFTIKKTTD